MMKNSLFLYVVVGFCALQSFAQLDPVHWKAHMNPVQEGSGHYELLFTATIAEGWHIYSQDKSHGDEGPIPTEFSFENAGQNFELLGAVQEPDGVKKFDKTFEMEIKYFEDEVIFIQKVKMNTASVRSIKANVLFMVCNDEMCLPPEVIDFEIPLLQGDIRKSNPVSELTPNDLAKTKALNIGVRGWDNFPTAETTEKGFMAIFLLGFLGGLIALLTPCVFPMIPLTVSFFTKKNNDRGQGKRNAFLYGFFILLIYLLLSLPFHLLDSIDPEILNTVSTNFFLNIVFFVVFVAFAISFFGYYELTLPASWSTKMDAKASQIGGVLGVFFMALTLALVSFSCTGPILGSLLGGTLSSDGGALQLSLGMGGFGLALALPFGLFALFPNWLNSLPKSGGWLNSIKVILGFLELGLAFKFLSNAELVKHMGIFKRELFIGIWLLVAMGLALYLFGKIKFPHDSPLSKIPLWRKVFGTVVIVFALYLVPGLTNTPYANLKLISGFPPPLSYSIYAKDEAKDKTLLHGYTDFEEGLRMAKMTKKPLLLDFTGWACVNCRKMEEQVWSVPEVHELIQKDYVLVSLYVDDREELPKVDQFNFLKPSGRLKKIKTVGDQWATFQTVNFKNNSQPYYVLLDHELNLLNKPMGYTPDAKAYAQWLSSGLQDRNTK